MLVLDATDSWRPIFLDLSSKAICWWPYDAFRFDAWAVTASERGEIGRMVGRMGIGATFEGPFDHVVLLPFGALAFAAGTSLTVWGCTGDGRGATAGVEVG